MVSNRYSLTDLALTDLDTTLSYICNELKNQLAAIAFSKRIEEAISTICLFPNSGALLENDFVKEKGVRKFIVDSYLIYYIYNSDDKMVYILRIVFARRNQSEIINTIDWTKKQQEE